MIVDLSDTETTGHTGVEQPTTRPRSKSMNNTTTKKVVSVPEDDDIEIMDVDMEEVTTQPKKRKRESTKATKTNKKQKLDDYDEEEELAEVEENDSLLSFDCVDFSKLKLKDDHMKRAAWVCPDYRVYLEAFSPVYREAYDFFIAVTHPLARTRLMHQYQITQGSLYAAISVGLTATQIIK